MERFSHVEIQNQHHSTRESPSPYIPMDVMTPRKNHRWTTENKVILVLLVRSYRNDWNEKKRVFNSYFGLHLSDGALRSMYHEIDDQFVDSAFGTWRGIRKCLESRAVSLGIILEDNDQIQVSQNTTTSITIHRKTRFPKLGFRGFGKDSRGYVRRFQIILHLLKHKQCKFRYHNPGWPIYRSQLIRTLPFNAAERPLSIRCENTDCTKSPGAHSLHTYNEHSLHIYYEQFTKSAILEF